jgi:hypothetical protein
MPREFPVAVNLEDGPEDVARVYRGFDYVLISHLPDPPELAGPEAWDPNDVVEF